MLHRNLPLKAAAVALAVFLWFWVLLNERNPIVEEPVRTAITAEGVKAGLALQGPLPTAEVHLRGLKQELGDIAPRVEALISCQGLEPGQHRLSVQARAPENVTVTSIRPPEVVVVLESVASEGRTVEVRLIGGPPAGYQLLGAEVSPKVVRVSGPQSRVDRGARVVVTMDLGRALPEVPVSLPVRAVDTAGESVEGVTLTPAHANVLVRMKPVVSPRTVPVVVRTRGAMPPGLRIASVQVEPAMATILGPAHRVQEVAQLQTEDLVLGRVNGSFTQELHLVVPDEVSLLGDPCVTVTVKVEKEAPIAAPPEETPQGKGAEAVR